VEALLSGPALIVTSDPADLERLIEGQPEVASVRVVAV
jgi:hypothetical protein